jgi:hypothetical protein
MTMKKHEGTRRDLITLITSAAIIGTSTSRLADSRSTATATAESIARPSRSPGTARPPAATATMRRAMVQVFALLLAVWLISCSGPKPILYPNDHYKSVGQNTAKHDIEECRTMAKDLGTSPGAGKAGTVAGQTAVGAGMGAASGAVGGAVVGAAGSGSAIGAASGAVAGLLSGLFSLFSSSGGPDPTYANIVNRCLTERGYEVAGWK